MLKNGSYTLLVLAVLVGITFGGWELGWWFKNQNMNRETNMYRHSNSYQQSYLTAVQNDIRQVDNIDTQLSDPTISSDQKTGINAQRNAVVDQACNWFSYLDPAWVTPNMAAFQATNCQ